jgi:hypothetical protein
VAQDHTVSWEGNRWGVPREEVCAGLPGAQVEIELKATLKIRKLLIRLGSKNAKNPGFA